jgi:hypothetical protein
MLLQLEQKFLQANLAQAQVLLADACQDDDPIGQHQFRQLVQGLEDKLSSMPQAIERAPAGVALFFGGRPVMGSHGIQAGFSGKAIERFQTMVSQRFAAQELGPLASKGRVPLKDNTHLMVTDVVRGSFGFVLQAAAEDDEAQGSGTSLKSVVGKVADAISRMAAQDDALFDGALAEIDERQKVAFSDFFKLLDTEGATMRIVEGERDFELDQASVQRARRRVENLQISDRSDEISGLIVGWSDVTAKFDLQLHGTREIVQGTVSRAELDRVELEGLELYHKHVRASIKVREVHVKNRQPKRAYTLLSLETIEAPAGWQAPSVQRVIQ